MTGAETTGNRQLAARARDLADQAEPGTLAWDGPGAVRAAAVRLLDQLGNPAQQEG